MHVMVAIWLVGSFIWLASRVHLKQIQARCDELVVERVRSCPGSSQDQTRRQAAEGQLHDEHNCIRNGVIGFRQPANRDIQTITGG